MKTPQAVDARPAGGEGRVIERRVQQRMGMPRLSQRQFARIFRAIAEVLRQGPYDLAHLSKAVRDRLVASNADLRVSYPSLQGSGGARVQVTLITDEERHGSKLRRIAHGEEFVVVSPLTLAGAVLGLGPLKSFTRAQRDEVFAALGRPAQTAGVVAAALKSHFLRALGRPMSPLGPLLSVAASIRHFIRVYVEREAHAAARQLQRRKAEGNAPPASRFKRDAGLDGGSSDEVTPRTDKDSMRRRGPDDLARRVRLARGGAIDTLPRT